MKNVNCLHFKSLQSRKSFLYYPGTSWWISPQICLRNKRSKNWVPTELYFTFDNPNHSHWLPKAYVRGTHRSRKLWGKLDKCYIWRNVKMWCMNLLGAAMLEIGWDHTFSRTWIAVATCGATAIVSCAVSLHIGAIFRDFGVCVIRAYLCIERHKHELVLLQLI